MRGDADMTAKTYHSAYPGSMFKDREPDMETGYITAADHQAALAKVRAEMEALAQKWHGETVVATTAFYNAAVLDKCCHESCHNELLALAAKVKP